MSYRTQPAEREREQCCPSRTSKEDLRFDHPSISKLLKAVPRDDIKRTVSERLQGYWEKATSRREKKLKRFSLFFSEFSR